MGQLSSTGGWVTLLNPQTQQPWPEEKRQASGWGWAEVSSHSSFSWAGSFRNLSLESSQPLGIASSL